MGFEDDEDVFGRGKINRVPDFIEAWPPRDPPMPVADVSGVPGECSFPGCKLPRTGRHGDHCETHKHEPNDCACRAGVPFHTDERCGGYRG
jgi:hypothetical protein